MAQESNIKTGLVWGYNEVGKRVLYFDGVPIVRSDYMVGEGANTGVGSDARTKTGSTYYSLFGLKFGRVHLQEPGCCLAFGGEGRKEGEIFRLEHFDKLEDYDASGQRLIAYCNLAIGSSMGIGRIYDITDAAITA